MLMSFSLLRAQVASHSKAVVLAAKPDRRMTAAREQLCSCKLPWQPRAAGGEGISHAAQPPGAEVISWCNEERGKERSGGRCSAVLSAISSSKARKTMPRWAPSNLYTWLPMKRVIKKCHCLLGKIQPCLKRMMIICITALFSLSLLFVLVGSKTRHNARLLFFLLSHTNPNKALPAEPRQSCV